MCAPGDLRASVEMDALKTSTVCVCDNSSYCQISQCDTAIMQGGEGIGHRDIQLPNTQEYSLKKQGMEKHNMQQSVCNITACPSMMRPLPACACRIAARNGFPVRQLTQADVNSVLHLTQEEAARKLQISVSVFKRACKERGFPNCLFYCKVHLIKLKEKKT